MRLVDIDDIRVMKFLSEDEDPSESDGEREYRNGWNDALTAVNDIQPSVQPELATDCISRQAAIDEILDQRGAEYHNEYECGYDDALRDAVEWLKRLPSAEPVRMKGKWNKIHWKAYRCSECERVSEYQSNFCPNCGADMRGEE